MQKKRTREEIAKEQSALIKGAVGFDDRSVREFYKKVSICNPDYHSDTQRAYRSKLWLKLQGNFPLTLENIEEGFILAEDLARMKKTRLSREKSITHLYHFLHDRLSSFSNAAARLDLLRIEWAIASLKYCSFSGRIPKGSIKNKNGIALVGGIAMLNQETDLDRAYPTVDLKDIRQLAQPKMLFLYRKPSTQEIEIMEPNRTLKISTMKLIRKVATTICADNIREE